MAQAITNPDQEADVPIFSNSGSPIDLIQISATPIFTAIPDAILTASLATPPFVPFPGSLNLRDLGLLPSSPFKPGILFRSGSLQNIGAVDLPKLRHELGIRTIFDLRHDGERQSFPEPIVEGVTMIWLRASSQPSRIDPSDFEAEHGIPGFVSMYRNLLELYASEYKRILELLRDEPGQPILWHCTAGKDRAGLFAMLLSSLCGVERSMIGFDYTLTRIGVEKDRQTLQSNMEKWLGKDAAVSLWPLNVPHATLSL